MNISYSRFSTYLSCPYKHYLAYVEGWVKNKAERPLYFGSDFHKLLEYRNRPDELSRVQQEIIDAYYNLPANQQSELGSNYVEDLFNIYADYCDVYKDCPLPDMTEVEFNIPIGRYKGEKVIFRGFIDELYIRPDGITVGEHKTFSKMPAKDYLVMNTQKSLYAKAVQKLYGEYPKTILWDYVHSQAASYPVWLEKSGKFSTASTTKVTPYSYIRACKEHNINADDGVAEKYKSNLVNFYFRTEMDCIPEMIEDVWQGFKYTCKDIVVNSTKNKTKNITYSCAWCQYRDICHAELTGADTDTILEKDFKRRENDGYTESEETD